IGQPLLLALYREAFAKYGTTSAQILLSAHNFDSRKQTENAKNMVEVLLQSKILPIINENDAVATAEIVFGDNDRLAAHVAHYFDCDLLIILSDIEGYYTKDPHQHKDATLRKVVHHFDSTELDASATPHTEFSTGGIVTKLQAAHFLMEHGKKMFLCNGFDLSAARDFLLHKTHVRGTLFCKES
ncbi:MAG: glutamate 5-kinase, partial [Helicobacter sp.]|nr:glutamate 5-kinase [Helicobacter sp.]